MTSTPADVFSLDYMNRLRKSLNTISGWPHGYDGSNPKSRMSPIYRSALIASMTYNIYSTILYSIKHMDTDLGQSYLNVLLASVYLQRLFLPFQKNFCLIVQKFILEFHLIHHKHKTDFNAEIYERVNKICKIFSTVSLIQVIAGSLLYPGIPLCINYKAGMFSDRKPENGIFQHSIDFELPFDQYTTYRGYFIVLIYNCFNSYNVATGVCMYDLLIFIIVFHMWGHLHILINDLKSFSQTADQCFEKSSVGVQDDMFNKLKDMIKHHQEIKGFMTSTSEAFSTPLCGYLIFHQLSGCVLLLKTCSLEAADLARYGLVTFIVFQQLIETSVIFELVHSKGDTLADKVYELPWERMDTRNRKILVMFLNSVQTSLALKAGGMVPVGVMTMSTIIKTSCSYFLILRTFTQS